MTWLENSDKKLDVVNDFNKLFSVKPFEKRGDEIPEGEVKGYLDPTHVCMVVPLRKGFKEALLSMFDVSESRIPELDYAGKLGRGGVYSCDYLKIILALCRHYESIRVKVGDEFPATFETEDFRIILAPRTDN